MMTEQTVKSRNTRKIVGLIMGLSLGLGASLPSSPLFAAGKTLDAATVAARIAQIRSTLVAQTQSRALELAVALKPYIKAGQLELETRDRLITIRLHAVQAFAPRSATLRPGFLPVLAAVRDQLKSVDGDLSVDGHTDDVPVSSARFPSNWSLSSAQASAVALELLQGGSIAPGRMVVKGYADTRPLLPNTTADNRARNRRVEILIDQGRDDAAYLSGEKPLPDVPVF